MNNKGKLIKLNDHYYVVDGSKPKEGDYYIDDTGLLRQAVTSDEEYWDRRKDYYKVTHSTQELEGVEFISHSEIEEFIYGYSIETLYEEPTINKDSKASVSFGDGYYYGFEDGFKAHKELTKDKLFTITDMIKFSEGVVWNIVGKTITESGIRELIIKLTQSLLPKTKWDIEIVNNKIKLL